MKNTFAIAGLFLASTYAIAGELVAVSVSNGQNEINLNDEQKQYIYGKAIGHLKTCSIGNHQGSSQRTSDENISKIEKTDHIKISFKKNMVVVPVGAGIKNVNAIYVMFHKGRNAIAQIATVDADKIQPYSKCSGPSALYNFTCDKVISEIMSISEHPSCADIVKHYEKRLWHEN